MSSSEATETFHPPEVPPNTENLTTLGVLDVFYAALFHPVTLFRTVLNEEVSVSKNQLFVYSICFVLFISGMSPALEYIKSGDENGLFRLMMQIPFHALLGGLLWLILGNILSVLSFALTGKSRAKNFLILSAYSILPFIFNAPLALLKQGMGIPGSFFGTLGGFGLFIWVSCLVSMAIGMTYQLSFDKVLLLLLLLSPSILLICLSSGVVSLIANLIFKIPG
ncbi:MAG: YIP1 family protein [Cyanobacteria bacterium]|nr:YIP1 family protein [Cyanobacteriota bacterium]